MGTQSAATEEREAGNKLLDPGVCVFAALTDPARQLNCETRATLQAYITPTTSAKESTQLHLTIHSTTTRIPSKKLLHNG